MAVQCLLSIAANLDGAGGLAFTSCRLGPPMVGWPRTLAWPEMEGHSQWGRVYAPAGIVGTALRMAVCDVHNPLG